jgi:hypothetical protein
MDLLLLLNVGLLLRLSLRQTMVIAKSILRVIFKLWSTLTVNASHSIVFITRQTNLTHNLAKSDLAKSDPSTFIV